MAARSDAEIIAQSLQHADAFEEIFDRHYEAIDAYLRRRIEAATADELASEAFLVAFRRRRDFDLTRSSARPWLFGIASNLLRSVRRAETRRLRAYARVPLEFEPDHAEAAIDRADADRGHRRLAAALLQLRKDERDILLLWSWSDLTYGELAEALDMPIGTVRSRLSRAREHVQELIGALGQTPYEGGRKMKSNE